MVVQSGVAGMSAFFKRQIENSGDVTMTNEQRVCEETNAPYILNTKKT